MRIRASRYRIEFHLAWQPLWRCAASPWRPLPIGQPRNERERENRDENRFAGMSVY